MGMNKLPKCFYEYFQQQMTKPLAFFYATILCPSFLRLNFLQPFIRFGISINFCVFLYCTYSFLNFLLAFLFLIEAQVLNSKDKRVLYAQKRNLSFFINENKKKLLLPFSGQFPYRQVVKNRCSLIHILFLNLCATLKQSNPGFFRTRKRKKCDNECLQLCFSTSWHQIEYVGICAYYSLQVSIS